MWLSELNKMKKTSKKTLDEISQESGIPKGTLNKLFAGQTKDPQLSTIQAVVHCLGYVLDDLSPRQADNITSPLIREISSSLEDMAQSDQRYVLDMINTYKKHLAENRLKEGE